MSAVGQSEIGESGFLSVSQLVAQTQALAAAIRFLRLAIHARSMRLATAEFSGYFF